MTDLEIWQAIQLIRNTVIQAHVKINEAMHQIEELAKSIQETHVSN